MKLRLKKPNAVASRSLISGLRAHLMERAPEYLGGAGPTTVRLLGSQSHLNCSTFRWEVRSAESSLRLLAKVPFSRADGRHDLPCPAETECPRMFPRVDPAHKARLEFVTLVRLATEFQRLNDPRFRFVRVQAFLPDLRALLMNEVSDPRLDVVLGQARRWRGKAATRALQAVTNAGAWLRYCHELAPLDHTRPRLHSRIEFKDSIQRYVDFLSTPPGLSSVAAGYFRSLAAEVGARAEDHLPQELPLGMAHSDFTPSNVFAGADGSVAVFDTIGRWQAPIYEDLARFRLALHCPNGWRAARSSAWTQGAQLALLHGYFGNASSGDAALALFDIQAALDRWASWMHAFRQADGVKRSLKQWRLKMAESVLRAYIDERRNQRLATRSRQPMARRMPHLYGEL